MVVIETKYRLIKEKKEMKLSKKSYLFNMIMYSAAEVLIAYSLFNPTTDTNYVHMFPIPFAFVMGATMIIFFQELGKFAHAYYNPDETEIVTSFKIIKKA